MTAEEYKQSLAKPGTTRVYWTMETFSTYVHLRYPHITVVPGQEWTRATSRYKFVCDKHGEYEAQANAILNHTTNRGPQCQGCQAENTARRNYEITLSRIGTTTPDGHLILEHVGYQAKAANKKAGLRGDAMYKYKCANCGNDQAVAKGGNLFNPTAKTDGCQECYTKRETIERHRRNKAKAMEPCQFYVASFYFDSYLKLGISKEYETRAAAGNSGNMYFDKNLTPEEHYKAGNLDLSYEHCWFLSPEYPRAWIFAVEQILLAATKHYAPKEALPKEVIETCWAGQSELRDFMLDPKQVEAGFFRLIKMIQQADGDWYQVYKEQINKFKI